MAVFIETHFKALSGRFAALWLLYVNLPMPEVIDRKNGYERGKKGHSGEVLRDGRT
jgi:hypothetical protein